MGNIEAVEDKRSQALAVLGAAMQKNGLTNLRLEYSGNGDDRDNFSILDKDKENAPVAIDEIIDAMEALVDTVVEGYENGNGGSGELTITIEDGTIEADWDHYDNTTDECPEGVAIPDETAEMIRNILPALGADTVTLEYNGGGDSMDGLNIGYSCKGTAVTVANKVDVLTKRIHDALEDLICDQVDGFWNNEGGRGEMCIATDSEEAEWDHVNFVDTTEQTHYAFSVALPVNQEVAA